MTPSKPGRALTIRTNHDGARLCDCSRCLVARAAPDMLEALLGLAHWRMRDGSPCFCPAGQHEDEPKGAMPTRHATACADARDALARAEGREP